MATFLSLAVRWPVVELIVVGLWIWSSLAAWKGHPNELHMEDVQERQLGASVMQAQLTGVLTASSIIVVGVGAFAALLNPLEGSIVFHLSWSAIYGLIAMVLAAYTMGLLPPRIARLSLVHSKAVSVLCSLSLCGVLLAGGRMLVGVGHLMFQ